MDYFDRGSGPVVLLHGVVDPAAFKVRLLELTPNAQHSTQLVNVLAPDLIGIA